METEAIGIERTTCRSENKDAVSFMVKIVDSESTEIEPKTRHTRYHVGNAQPPQRNTGRVQSDARRAVTSLGQDIRDREVLEKTKTEKYLANQVSVRLKSLILESCERANRHWS